jgi:uroporphyrinogen-III synthase
MMTLPLAGTNIALAEGRQLEELATLLEKEGATPVRCPLLTILDAPDPEPVLQWMRALIAGEFGLLILLTGEGVRRFVALAERYGLREGFIEALRRTPTLTRGPKPGQALKELGLRPTYVAAAPTTAGVIATLREHSLAGTTVGVQLYSENNPPLTNYLTEAGANVRCVQPYYYAPAADADRVAQLLEQMAQGTIAVLVFTSSPQVERVYEVVAERHLTETWQRGLARTKLASVGPVVTETLTAKGLRVDIQPEQGFQMKNLVVHIRRALANG